MDMYILFIHIELKLQPHIHSSEAIHSYMYILFIGDGLLHQAAPASRGPRLRDSCVGSTIYIYLDTYIYIERERYSMIYE